MNSQRGSVSPPLIGLNELNTSASDSLTRLETFDRITGSVTPLDLQGYHLVLCYAGSRFHVPSPV